MEPTAENDAVQWMEHLTRVGWLSKGFVYVLIGVIAGRIGLRAWPRGDSEEANAQGALHTVAEQPFGRVIVGALGLGLVIFMVWNVAQAVVPGSTDLEPVGLAKRIGWFGLGLFYGALGIASFKLAFRGGSSSSSAQGSGSGSGSAGDTPTSPPALTAQVMDWTGGRWLVALTGVIVGVVAIYQLRKGVTKGFLDDLDTGGLSSRARDWLSGLGVAGFVARALVLSVVAWFLVRAAVTYRSSAAVGLDGALRELAGLTYGRVLLSATALGLALAGVYDMVTFRRQQIR